MRTLQLLNWRTKDVAMNVGRVSVYYVYANPGDAVQTNELSE